MAYVLLVFCGRNFSLFLLLRCGNHNFSRMFFCEYWEADSFLFDKEAGMTINSFVAFELIQNIGEFEAMLVKQARNSDSGLVRSSRALHSCNLLLE